MAPRKKTARKRPSSSKSLARELVDADASLLVGATAKEALALRGVIPTGIVTLDIATGIGGLPMGRLSMIQGAEGGGKTTFALSCCASVQQMGGVAVYYDPERKLLGSFAENIGVDLDAVVYHKPLTMEAMALKLVQVLNRTKNMSRDRGKDVPVLVVVDSITALKTGLDTSLEKMVDEGTAPRVGAQAAIMSATLRDVLPALENSPVALLFVSQLRTKLTSFGAQQDTTCGNAPKFYSTVIIQARPDIARESGKKVGHRVECEVVKNQVAAPFRRGYFEILGKRGIDKERALLDASVELGLAKKSKKGGWFTYGTALDELKVQGSRGLRVKSRKEPDADWPGRIRKAVMEAAEEER